MSQQNGWLPMDDHVIARYFPTEQAKERWLKSQGFTGDPGDFLVSLDKWQ